MAKDKVSRPIARAGAHGPLADPPANPLWRYAPPVTQKLRDGGEIVWLDACAIAPFLPPPEPHR